MAARTKAEQPEAELDADDYWTELISENVVPPMKVKGIVLEQPTSEVVEKWQAGGMSDDKLIFGDQYDEVEALFKDKPVYVKKNFFAAYMKHMFGIEGDSLKG